MKLKILFFILLGCCCVANAFFDIHVGDKVSVSIEEGDDYSGEIKKTKSEKNADLLDDRINYYDERFGTDKSLALALIDVAKLQKKNILNTYAEYYRVRCPDKILTAAEMDFKTQELLKEIGFKKKASNWFYDGAWVNVGKPSRGKINKKKVDRDLFFDVKASITPKKSILIKVRTNLPDESFLSMTIYNISIPGPGYNVDSVFVKDSIMELEIFLPKINKGIYTLDIYENVKGGLGNYSPTSEDLQHCSKNVKFIKYFGRQIIWLTGVEILRIKKDIIVDTTNITKFTYRKTDCIKHVVENEPDLIDSRDVEKKIIVEKWFGFSKKTEFIKVKSTKRYKTVKIGETTWMAENLNYATRNSICYNNDEKMCNKFGLLYNWEDAKNACPEGWRLPSKDELNKLIDASKNKLSENLKSSMEWIHNNGNNELGFNALPAGELTGENFNGLGTSTYFWSDSEANKFGEKWSYGLFLTDDVDPFISWKNASIKVSKQVDYHSIRCVKKN